MPTKTAAPRSKPSGTAVPGLATGRIRRSRASKGHTIREVPAPATNPDGGFVIDTGPASPRIDARLSGDHRRPQA